jgi:para-aminobenzoate synthetase component 1
MQALNEHIVTSDCLAIEADAGRFLDLAGRARGEAALLLSDGVHPLGRHSILALWPYLEFTYRRGWAELRVDRQRVHAARTRRPLEILDRILAHHEPFLPAHFPGGAIGFLGYDFGHELLGLPRRDMSPASPLPDIQFRCHRCHLLLDHATGRAEAHLLGIGRSIAEAAGDLRRTRERLRRLLRTAAPGIPAACVTRAPCSPPRLLLDQPAYLKKIRRIRHYIRHGHVYQVNFSHAFEMEWDEPGLRILERLFAINPVPFGAWVPYPGGEIVSLSPECFLRREGDRILTRPIKGTRPRGGDPLEDRRLAQDLLTNPKDGAELAMIVDLERNDLGRICKTGTVRVVRHRELETYSTLHHTASTVEGRLAVPRLSEILAATFPGGSITGVPKRRCVEIIAELEDGEREIYTGAMGIARFGGDFTFNLAIRTLIREGTTARFRMGGGIVYDSDPEAEYQETLHKAQAFYLAAGGIRP